MISILAYGGLRPSETLGLKVGDIDFGAGGLWVRDTVSSGHRIGDTKTHRARFAPVPAAAMRDIRIWLDVLRGTGRDWLFPGKRGQEHARHHGGRDILRAASMYLIVQHPDWVFELDGLTPYALRHTAASMRVRARDPLPEIAEDLGHTVETLVTHYTHVIRAQHRQPVISIDEQIRRARVSFRTDRAGRDLRQRLLSRSPRHEKPPTKALNPDALWILGWEDAHRNPIRPELVARVNALRASSGPSPAHHAHKRAIATLRGVGWRA
jgi:hypothetical protein